jgi:hypothetical protein
VVPPTAPLTAFAVHLKYNNILLKYRIREVTYYKVNQKEFKTAKALGTDTCVTLNYLKLNKLNPQFL